MPAFAYSSLLTSWVTRFQSKSSESKETVELMKSVAYPSDFWALIRFKFEGGKEIVMPKLDYVHEIINVY